MIAFPEHCQDRIILRARYVLPVDRPPIENGAVQISAGRVQAVGPASDFAKTGATDLGDAVLIPGFVNAHTHLELTGVATASPRPGDFVGWLRSVYKAVIANPPTREAVEQAVTDGLALSLATGTTSLGDISRHPAWTRPVLARSLMRSVSFGEVIAIGARRQMFEERLAAALSDPPPGPVTAGLSPHAPYTVEPEAMRACAQRAAGRPLCIHLAESAEESRFTLEGTGPLADFLREIGVWDVEIPVAGCSPVELAHRTGLLTPRTVLAHANYISEADLQIVAASGASVAYCPRTHAAFAHPPHRFRDMLRVGINVCIATDSLATTPTLSVLDDLRFLHAHCPDVQPETLLEMGTLRPARALGLSDHLGSLTPGKRADIAVLPLANGSEWHSVFAVAGRPSGVFVAGTRAPD